MSMLGLPKTIAKHYTIQLSDLRLPRSDCVYTQTGSEVIKKLCSTQLSMKIFMLINKIKCQ